jgi:hypothetical protein
MKIFIQWIASLVAVAGLVAHAHAGSSQLRVVSDVAVGGFAFPESAAYDAKAKMLYVGNFGGEKLDALGKERTGYISKVALDGKIIEQHFLPAGGEKMYKPKGIWVAGKRLWVTDVDALWEFDLETRKGKRLEIPGIVSANDVAVLGRSAYVSDNRSDRLYRIQPADFLNAKASPEISVVLEGRAVYPNGLYPGKHGELVMVGFQSARDPRGIYALDKYGDLKELAKPIGLLDGLSVLRDGSLLVTDWTKNGLFRWTEKDGLQPLATGFKGPADLTAWENPQGVNVVVPDLPGNEIRIIRLDKWRAAAGRSREK